MLRIKNISINTFFLVLLSFAFAIAVQAQPVNDDCGGIIDLGVLPSCAPAEIYTNVDATTSDIGLGNIPGCFFNGSVERDVWFSFTTTDDIIDINISLMGSSDGVNGSITNPKLVLYGGSCEFDGLSELACISSNDGDTSIQLEVLGLTANETYFLRVNDFAAAGNPNWGDFTLCVEEYIDAPDLLSIYVDTINYTRDTLDANLYYVPVRVVNMEEIASFDITIETGAGATMVGVSDTLVPAAGTIISLPNDTTLRLLYLDFTGSSLTIADHEAIFVMAVHYEGLPGDCFPFNITAFEAVHVDDPSVTVPFTATAGEICLPSVISISGNILDYDLMPLDSVRVQLIQGDSSYFAFTDTMGIYLFEDIAIGDTITIVPTGKTNEDTRDERIAGINIIDYIKIAYHILGTSPLDNPYKVIAADINDSHTITTADLIKLRSYIIFRIDNYLPDNAFYRFFDADFDVSDLPAVWPTDIPEAISIDPINNIDGVNFIGVRIGNVH